MVPNNVKCYVALKSVALQHGFTSANTHFLTAQSGLLFLRNGHTAPVISPLSFALSSPAASISTSSLPPSVFMLSTVRP